MAMAKDEIKTIIGRSPDSSDTWIMRMYFQIRNKMSPFQSEQKAIINEKLQQQFTQRKRNFTQNSSK
jgi:hypothetical protein